MTSPTPDERPVALPRVARRVDHARDVPAGLTLGRCHRCGNTYAWKGRDGARLADVPCLRCERCTLEQTSRRLQRPVELYDDDDVRLLARTIRAERRAADRRRIARGTAVRVRDLQPGTIVSIPGIVGRLRVLDLREPDTGAVWAIVGDESTGHHRTVYRNGREVLPIVRPDRVVAGVPERDVSTVAGIRVNRWHGRTVDARRDVLQARLAHVDERIEVLSATIGQLEESVRLGQYPAESLQRLELRQATDRAKLDGWNREQSRVVQALGHLDEPHPASVPAAPEESTP